MTDTLSYRFDELPLLVIDGFEAGQIAGEAEILFDNEGWSIGEITLDGYRQKPTDEWRDECALAQLTGKPKPSLMERRQVALDSASALYAKIITTLFDLKPWSDSITDEVKEARAGNYDGAVFGGSRSREYA